MHQQHRELVLTPSRYKINAMHFPSYNLTKRGAPPDIVGNEVGVGASKI